MNEQYNYHEVIKWLEGKGKNHFGAKFKICKQDFATLHLLLIYFLNDEPMAKRYEIDLSKGILLAGPVGSGKTTIMTLMKNVAAQDKKFFVKPCREVSFEFIKDGYQTIDRYSTTRQFNNFSRNICFDDLGTEKNLKYFGNECNVMAEILLSRYDLFIQKKTLTHITTNLMADEIEAAYGNRLRSRMRSMLNLVTFPANTIDKR